MNSTQRRAFGNVKNVMGSTPVKSNLDELKRTPTTGSAHRNRAIFKTPAKFVVFEDDADEDDDSFENMKFAPNEFMCTYLPPKDNLEDYLLHDATTGSEPMEDDMIDLRVIVEEDDLFDSSTDITQDSYEEQFKNLSLDESSKVVMLERSPPKIDPDEEAELEKYILEIELLNKKEEPRIGYFSMDDMDD